MTALSGHERLECDVPVWTASTRSTERAPVRPAATRLELHVVAQRRRTVDALGRHMRPLCLLIALVALLLAVAL